MGLMPIDQVSLNAEKLVHDHPPQWRHRNKRLVYEIACSSGFSVQGKVDYARWPAQELPDDLSAPSQFSIEPLRVSRRLQHLREWSHYDSIQKVFT